MKNAKEGDFFFLAEAIEEGFLGTVALELIPGILWESTEIGQQEGLWSEKWQRGATQDSLSVRVFIKMEGGSEKLDKSSKSNYLSISNMNGD